MGEWELNNYICCVLHFEFENKLTAMYVVVFNMIFCKVSFLGKKLLFVLEVLMVEEGLLANPPTSFPTGCYGKSCLGNDALVLNCFVF